MVRAYLPVPRPADIVYAPIDLAMAIGEGLQDKGHEVTFFAPKGSTPPTKLESYNLKPLTTNSKQFQDLVKSTDMQMHYIPGLWDYYYVRAMFERARAGEYDILHFHHTESALPFASLYPDVPVVYTVHDAIFPWYQDVFDMCHSDNQYYVSISDNQRSPAPHLPYIATIYNGIHLKDYPFSDSHDDYLLYAGRIVPEKGVAEAVQLAIATKHKLLIIGPLFDNAKSYFNKQIKPYLNDDIQYLGYKRREEIAPYMQRAKAFLMPITWEEPFGVTMIEAMASGTPVIATRRGAVPEVVVDGVTGFIVDSAKGMANALRKVNSIDRRACREHVEKNFSIPCMVDNYEKTFLKVLKERKNASTL